jgi:hypothetical protein
MDMDAYRRALEAGLAWMEAELEAKREAGVDDIVARVKALCPDEDEERIRRDILAIATTDGLPLDEQIALVEREIGHRFGREALGEEGE